MQDHIAKKDLQTGYHRAELVPNRTYINTGGCGGLSTDDLGGRIFDNQWRDIRRISLQNCTLYFVNVVQMMKYHQKEESGLQKCHHGAWCHFK